MKNILLTLIIITTLLSSCRKDDINDDDIVVTDMSDLVISEDFDWKTIKTINVQLTLPEDDALRILYIYSEDGSRLYFKGHPSDGSNVLEAKVTIPTYEHKLSVKYGKGENYPSIKLSLVGTDLTYSITSYFNTSLKSNASSNSFLDFPCMTLWSVDDQPGKLHYT